VRPLAITRAISASFASALVRDPSSVPPDPVAAREEHRAYVRALELLGFEVAVLPADDRFPDACFVEDCALVHEGVALLTRTGAPSRRHEGDSLRDVLAAHVRVETMQAPATLEGGDCLRIGQRLYVGRGARTNAEGIARAREVFGPLGLEVVTVPLGDVLHLKCLASPVGRGRLLLVDGTLAPSIFAGVEPIRVPAEESAAANAIGAGDQVLMAQGFPRTRAALEAAGFRVLTIDNAQIRKADGALTCMSLRLRPEG
jgi:dimethylargininase